MDQRVINRGIPLLLFALIGCSGDGPSGTGASEYYLSARIDGVAWEADPSMIIATPGAASAPGWLGFQGSSLSGGGRTMAVNLSRIPGPGTYPIGINIGTNTGGIVTVAMGSQGWNTPLSGAAGSITLTAISNEAVTGTFQFSADRVGSTPVTSISVVEGRFRVPRSPGFVAATPDEVGSSASATIGGVPWNGATIVGVGSPQTLFTVSMSNDRYTMNVSVGPVTAPGAGPLTAGVPVRRVSVQRAGGGAWGGTAGDQGTLTITSLSATRIAGTISATLAPIAGTTGTLQISDARFDVRLP